MISYIKIYGPPIVEAIKALEKVAIDFPEVCIMHTELSLDQSVGSESIGSLMEGWSEYFGGPEVISEERCSNIISKSSESLGEYDFFFEWFKDPSKDEHHQLLTKIDDALSDVGVRYTITTK